MSVLPNMTLGKSLDPSTQGFPSTAAMVALLYKGQIVDYHRTVPRRTYSPILIIVENSSLSKFFSEYFVDVQDVGRLHVAATVLDKVRSERIFAFAARYNWDAVLGILRKLEPRTTFPDNFSGGDDPNEIQPRYKAEGYLRDLGRPGWTTLEESVRNMVVQFQDLEDSKTD